MTIIDGWRQNRFRLTRGQNAAEFIPTWEVGNEQRNPNDTQRFISEGYSKNSLVYSCIKEKATSYSALRPMVVNANGVVVEDHRMVELLADPNPSQDGQEFAELAFTQLEATGNAYIWMVRRTDDPDRRSRFATYPVQELRLLRPDYVSIEPGRSKRDDKFLVTVGGSVVARIPRSDIIHVHEPSLTNDYYGQSKISLLTREITIDLQMSDFELSFFRNAGVPMGILNVKGRTTEEQTAEIKSRFRASFNGLKRWFDVLVLNADETSYQQLGLAQADMEMEGTRAQVESRICSVFGIPPIIVGARFAMTSGQSFNYEVAQYAFWSETMVPDSMRFARSFEKHLLPEFATAQDRKSRVTYDFSQVRALQEDRSRKFREVTRMVNTGAFTVNQSLTLNGLPAIDGGDFYLRSANMSEVFVNEEGEREVFTTLQPSTGAVEEPDNPLEGAAKLAVEEAERLTIWRNGPH